ncbi:MAG: hypothetical protein JSS53_02220 [Proteobacteria bacterium]|nr:hypothetical protein [Pseudomonadota bacterium]
MKRRAKRSARNQKKFSKYPHSTAKTPVDLFAEKSLPDVEAAPYQIGNQPGNSGASSNTENYYSLFMKAVESLPVGLKDFAWGIPSTFFGLTSGLVYYTSAKVFGSDPGHTFGTEYIHPTIFSILYILGTVGSNQLTAVPFLIDITNYYRRLFSSSKGENNLRTDAEKSGTFYEISLLVLAMTSALSLALIGIDPNSFGTLDIIFTILGWIVFAAMNHFSLRGFFENMIPYLKSPYEMLKQKIFSASEFDAIDGITLQLKKMTEDAIQRSIDRLLNDATIRDRYQNNPDIMEKIAAIRDVPSRENLEALMNGLLELGGLPLDIFAGAILSSSPFKSFFDRFSEQFLSSHLLKSVWNNVSFANLNKLLRFLAIATSIVFTIDSILGYMVSTTLKLHLFNQTVLSAISLGGESIIEAILLYSASTGLTAFALAPFILLMIQVAIIITGSLYDTGAQAVSALASVFKHSFQKIFDFMKQCVGKDPSYPEGFHIFREIFDNIELLFPVEMRHNKTLWTGILAVCIFIACFSFSGANSLLETDFLQADFFDFSQYPSLYWFIWIASALSTAEFNSYGFKELPQKLAAFIATFLDTYFPGLVQGLEKIRFFNPETVPDMQACYFTKAFKLLFAQISPAHVTDLIGQWTELSTFKWLGFETVNDDRDKATSHAAEKLLVLALCSKHYLDKGIYTSADTQRIKDLEKDATSTYETARNTARNSLALAMQAYNQAIIDANKITEQSAHDNAIAAAKATLKTAKNAYQDSIASALTGNQYLTELANVFLRHLNNYHDTSFSSELRLDDCDVADILKGIAEIKISKAKESNVKQESYWGSCVSYFKSFVSGDGTAENAGEDIPLNPTRTTTYAAQDPMALYDETKRYSLY